MVLPPIDYRTGRTSEKPTVLRRRVPAEIATDSGFVRPGHLNLSAVFVAIPLDPLCLVLRDTGRLLSFCAPQSSTPLPAGEAYQHPDGHHQRSSYYREAHHQRQAHENSDSRIPEQNRSPCLSRHRVGRPVELDVPADTVEQSGNHQNEPNQLSNSLSSILRRMESGADRRRDDRQREERDEQGCKQLLHGLSQKSTRL